MFPLSDQVSNDPVILTLLKVIELENRQLSTPFSMRSKLLHCFGVANNIRRPIFILECVPEASVFIDKRYFIYVFHQI